MISDKDISIVVQGPILNQAAYGITSELTKFICARLKTLFPESELIISTWEGESTDGIFCDKIIYNSDPGATWFNYNDYNHLNNCNRLIVSTLGGVKAASRKYVLKVRSDLFLVSKKFLQYFEQFKLYNDEYKFVDSRIIAFSLNTLYGHKTRLFTMHRPFHISDWAYFGYKTDLLNLYDIPLVDEPDFSQWFLTRCKPFFDIEPQRLWKMPPEQYITYAFLKKYYPVTLEHTADTSNDNIALSSRLLTNNFLILDQSQFFLISLKYLYFVFSSSKGYEWYISHGSWLRNYCRHMEINSFSKKIKYHLQILMRGFFYCTFNGVMRILNGKNYRICRFIAYFIKHNNKKIDFKMQEKAFEYDK